MKRVENFEGQLPGPDPPLGLGPGASTPPIPPLSMLMHMADKTLVLNILKILSHRYNLTHVHTSGHEINCQCNNFVV